MKSEQILSASLVDIVFDGRNKEYGAYELRQQYDKQIGKALGVMGVIVLAAVFIATASTPDNKPRFSITTGSTITVLKTEDKPLVDPPKPKPVEPVTRTQKFDNFKIVDKIDITPPPSQDDLVHADIGNVKTDGDDFKNIQQPKTDVPGTDLGVIDKRPSGDEIVTTVEVEAKYPGDWKKFLEHNLNPEVPVSNSAPAGRYSVVIQFIVDKEGNVSDINPLTAHGYGMEQEAIRVIKKAPKWEPAFQNGIHVKAYRRQVIVFEVNEE